MTKSRDIASAIPAPSTISSAELGYLDGVTSAIQTQLDAKAPSSTAVTLTGTQTLTNKTLTTPVISTITTKGDLLGYDTALNRVPIGTNNQVLTADSAQALGLKWATAGGGYTELATGSLSSTVTNITAISSAYKDLKLVVRQFLPTTDNRGFNLYFNADTGTRYASLIGSADSQSFSGASFVASASNDNAVATGLTVVDIPDYANAVTWKFATFNSIGVQATTTTDFNWKVQQGVYNQTTAISQINILGGNGTSMTSGTYILYGVK